MNLNNPQCFVCINIDCNQFRLINALNDLQNHPSHQVIQLKEFWNQIQKNSQINDIIQNITLIQFMMDDIVSFIKFNFDNIRKQLSKEVELVQAYHLLENNDLADQKAINLINKLIDASVNSKALNLRNQELQQIGRLQSEIFNILKSDQIDKIEQKFKQKNDHKIEQKIDKNIDIAQKVLSYEMKLEQSRQTLNHQANDFEGRKVIKQDAILLIQSISHGEKQFLGDPPQKTTIFHVYVIDKNGEIQYKEFQHKSKSWTLNDKYLLGQANTYCAVQSGKDPQFGQ